MKAIPFSLACLSAVLVLSGCLTAATMSNVGLVVLSGDSTLEQLPISPGERSLSVDITRGLAVVPGLAKVIITFIPNRDGTVRLKVRIPSENLTTRPVKIDSIQAQVDSSSNPVKLEFRDTVLVALDKNVVVKFLKGSRFYFRF